MAIGSFVYFSHMREFILKTAEYQSLICLHVKNEKEIDARSILVQQAVI